jgi:hypothetical protein
MQAKIDTLTTAIESLRNARLALDNIAKTEAELKAARKKLQAQLDNAPVESLAVPGGEDRAFDHPTSRALSARDDIDIKLDLLPGIRVRYQAQAEGLNQRIRIAVKALARLCRDEAEAKLEQQQVEVRTYLLKFFSGDAERAKSAAAKIMLASDAWNLPVTVVRGCDACRWLDTFAHYMHAHDPLEDAETVIGLAQRFDRGDPCD